MKAPKSATAPKGKGNIAIWLQGLACGTCVALAPGPSMLVGVLLAPAIAMLMVDRTPGRPAARAVLLCGAAASVGPLTMLWRMGGANTGNSLAMLSDPAVFSGPWAACAAGWLLTQMLPIGIRVVLEATSLSRAARLRAERERLAAEWGLEG